MGRFGYQGYLVFLLGVWSRTELNDIGHETRTADNAAA